MSSAASLGGAWMSTVVVALALVACTGDRQPVSTAPTAKYTVEQYVEGRNDPVLTVEGRGDFARAVMVDTRYLRGRPFVERLTIDNVTYTRYVDEDHWEKGVDAATPEARALIAIRNALFDPSRSISYLRSVSTDVTAAGQEDVRGDRTTRYRATVDLGRADGPPGYVVALDVWVDKFDRTRRLRHPILGESESIVVWELYDFGVPVDVAPPPTEQVR